MPRFVYRGTLPDDFTDMRWVASNYVLQSGEIEGVADVLPIGNQLFARQARIIAFPAFIMRWTDPEYALLMQRRATAVAAGNVTLIKLWDAASSRGSVDLSNPNALTLKNTIVAAGILTQQRADVIWS